jgi:hypothetical protein
MNDSMSGEWWMSTIYSTRQPEGMRKKKTFFPNNTIVTKVTIVSQGKGGLPRHILIVAYFFKVILWAYFIDQQSSKLNVFQRWTRIL